MAIAFGGVSHMLLELGGSGDAKQPVHYPPPHANGAAHHLSSGHQLVAVDASISPTDASQRSASIAALQPSPAAVTACR